MQSNWDVMSLLFKLKSIKKVFLIEFLLFRFYMISLICRLCVRLTIPFAKWMIFHYVDLKGSLIGYVIHINLQLLDSRVTKLRSERSEKWTHARLLSKLSDKSLMRKQTFSNKSLHIFVQRKKYFLLSLLFVSLKKIIVEK